MIRLATGADRDRIVEIVSTVLGEFGLTLDANDTDADLAEVPFNYVQSGGTFLVLEDENGDVVGCGGLFGLGQQAELRKMYLLPAARGHGEGRALLDALLKFARSNHYSTVVLHTNSRLQTALRMYERYGFATWTPEHATPCRCDISMQLPLS